MYIVYSILIWALIYLLFSQVTIGGSPVSSVSYFALKPSQHSSPTSTTMTSSSSAATKNAKNNDSLLINGNNDNDILKDMEKVYLFTFPPVPHVYNICPFAIKLEAYLRINNISHQVIYTTKFSAKKTIPYIRINDPHDPNQEISDSNIIIHMLKNHIKSKNQQQQQQKHDEDNNDNNGDNTILDCDANLTIEQQVLTHSITRMLEEHTAQIGFHYRYGLQMDKFYSALNIPDRFGSPLADRWIHAQPKLTFDKSKYRGLLRYTESELWDLANQDWQIISNLLGSNNNNDNSDDDNDSFMFGKATPNTLDCAIFGHLVQFLLIPIDFPQQDYIKKNCPNLIAFMNKFQRHVFPDWEMKCEKATSSKY